jgi:hypothetical protein
MGVGPIVTEFAKKLGPSEEVSQHFRAARLEILKGLRAMLDEQIAGMAETPKHGTKFSVE